MYMYICIVNMDKTLWFWHVNERQAIIRVATKSPKDEILEKCKNKCFATLNEQSTL